MSDPKIEVKTYRHQCGKLPLRIRLRHRWHRFRIGKEGRELEDASFQAFMESFLFGSKK